LIPVIAGPASPGASNKRSIVSSAAQAPLVLAQAIIKNGQKQRRMNGIAQGQ
jgi:hypothetical protein